ncbi:hypothetical protein HMPREF3291_05280 [Bacillus sp. HMSC76G11]|nr:hypothetical protein HMPREF3291_05280 [Bacillus sp. HMSC76G11]
MELEKDEKKDPIKQRNEELKLIQRIQNHFTEARMVKAEEEKNWKVGEDFYRGKQWKSTPAYKGQLQPVTNICFSIVESIVPQLTDNRPQIVTLPQEPDDEQKADILTQVIEYVWDKTDMDYKLQLNERTRIKHGMSIYKVFWDPEAMRGLGDIDIINVPIDQFFISPRAKNVQDSDYVIYATQKTTDYIEKRYKKKVQSDKRYDEITVFDDEEDTGKQDNKVLLLEYWTKENGKLRLITIANETVLRDEVGFYEHGLYPFVAVPAFPVEKKFWAMGVLSQIISPQMIVNILDQQIIDNARLGGSGTIYNGVGSGLNKNAMTNLPFKILDVTDPNLIKVESGQNIPSFIPNHLEIKKRDAESVSGIHDVSQGKAPSGVTAASAILALQESANQRIRLLGRTLEAGLKEMGELIIAVVKDFYTEERNIRILGDDRKPKFVKFKSSDLKKTKEYTNFTPEGAVKEEIEIDPDFDIRVEVGSSMQYSKAFLYEQAKELFGMGVIDDKALLETIRFPKAEEVLQRKEELMQQEQQMMAMQQQQMPMDGAMPPPMDEPMDEGMAVPDEVMEREELIATLPPDLRERFENASPEEQDEIIEQIMGNMQA